MEADNTAHLSTAKPSNGGFSVVFFQQFPLHSSKETDEFIRTAENREDADLRLKMLSSDHLAFPHKENLNDCVGFIVSLGDYIFVVKA